VIAADQEIAMSEVIELVSRDRQMFKQRLAGKSIRAIAQEFRLSVRETQDIVMAMCTGIDVRMRIHTLELELERLDELQGAFHERALDGDVPAGALVLKISERRAQLLGLDAPVRLDLNQIEAIEPRESSFDKIKAALDAVARERLKKPDKESDEPIPAS
jgi:hypothetical protein